ncbi:hypothetical protein [Clostridium sp.]|uniref:hypothetical protein n=1 Tax=Clostridium sp. TaxID=1506 RepID=UPI002FC5E1C6
MLKFKVLLLGNHWYPNIKHELGCIDGFSKKINRYLNIIDIAKYNEMTIEFEELGVIFGGINIIYFNEEDIVRYLTTDDDFDLRFIINNHEFTISSYLYWLLEDQFNFNFSKTSYRIHIY